MDLILYVLVFSIIGVYNVYKNNGFTIEAKSELAEAIADSSISSVVDTMEVGTNPYGRYNPEAFCYIVKQLGLM